MMIIFVRLKIIRPLEGTPSKGVVDTIIRFNNNTNDIICKIKIVSVDWDPLQLIVFVTPQIVS